MHIVNIINSILQAMVDDPDCELKSWQYNDLSTANVRLDNKKPSPTAVFLQISDWTMGCNAINIKESAQINISFLEKESKLDAGGLEQDEIIDRMKALAIDFIQRLKNVSALKIEDDEYKIKSVFLRSDSNRSGVNLQLTVKERQGECINGTYNPVMTVTENGLYNVAGYTQIIVDLPECPECPVCPEPPIPPTGPDFCIMALENDVQVSMTHYGTNKTTTKPTLYWTRNLQDYYLLNDTVIVLPNIGDKVWLYGDNPNGISNSVSNYSTFAINGECTVSGDVTTLLDRAGLETLTAPYAFNRLFYGCSSITTAPSLPSTTLSDYCYRGMFGGCTNLAEAPELPAETLAYRCYREMFSGCTSLTVAPELPATTLAEECYYSMFSGCTSLTSAPTLTATTLASGCYSHMFDGCSSLVSVPELPATTLMPSCYSYMFRYCTSLATAPELPATTLAGSCYYEMFSGCTSMTAAPELPSTELATNCYASMFNGCTSLTEAPALPATTMKLDCYYGMFSGCSSLVSAPELPATTLYSECYRNMFSGCTSLTSAPELPAETLVTRCYNNMFKDCTALHTITCLATNISATDSTLNWVNGVSANGIFNKAASMNDWPTGDNGIPDGWTVINY